MFRKTYVEVNIDNLKDNVKNIVNCYKNYNYYFGVVKGNCYGHGITYVINELIDSGINYLAVSSLEEALEARNINKKVPILSLEPIAIEYLDICSKNNITITVHDYDYAKKILEKKINKKLKIHLKIDSGMNRLGFKKKEELNEIYRKLKNKENIDEKYRFCKEEKRAPIWPDLGQPEQLCSKKRICSRSAWSKKKKTN